MASNTTRRLVLRATIIIALVYLVWLLSGPLAYGAEFRDIAMSDTFTVFSEPGTSLAHPTLELAERHKPNRPMPATTIKIGYGERRRAIVWHRDAEAVVYLTIVSPDELPGVVKWAIGRAGSPR